MLHPPVPILASASGAIKKNSNFDHFHLLSILVGYI
uniref:Uncharacterized protein n=1 Tax=Arundo donax TaxID=35708 RepID=A0A0A8Z632_ARUDO